MTIRYMFSHVTLSNDIKNLCRFLRALPRSISGLKVYLYDKEWSADHDITEQEVPQSIVESLKSGLLDAAWKATWKSTPLDVWRRR